MTTPLASLIASGTRLWLDSVDPGFVRQYREIGATGATSNPVIISGLIRSGQFDDELQALTEQYADDGDVAWELTDRLVRRAQEVFADVWEQTSGDDGYVSFELDPLLEAEDCPLSETERVAKYIELGKKWASGHTNRMIKVPATPAGLGALEELAAAGVTLNVTLIFTQRQYEAARDAIWRGAQRRDSLTGFKSVYSIFVSRIDVYTEKHLPELSAEAQGMVGLVNAKRLWQQNAEFWQQNETPLSQEIVFASTGTKLPSDPKDRYVAALAGADIQTNPPETNEAISQIAGKTFTRQVDQLPPQPVLDEIDTAVDFDRMEEVLMREGVKKFVDPQRELLALIAERRKSLAS